MNSVTSLLRTAAPKIGLFEARLLLAHVLKVRTEHLIAHPEEEVPEAAAESFLEFLRRRAEGVPYPYLVGEQEFYGRTFRVTPDVLIPRPDTELLVETALDALRGKRGARVLDMGTGSGCIAVTIAREVPGLEVFASDFSEGALSVARENARGTGVRFFKGSWFGALPAGTAPFDLIVSNPPYVSTLSPYLTDLGYEPKTALVSGEDGLDDIRVIAAQAPEHLVSGGGLMIEHGFDQGDACRKIFEENGFKAVRTLKDYGQNDRLTLGWK